MLKAWITSCAANGVPDSVTPRWFFWPGALPEASFVSSSKIKTLRSLKVGSLSTLHSGWSRRSPQSLRRSIRDTSADSALLQPRLRLLEALPDRSCNARHRQVADVPEPDSERWFQF